MNDRDIDDMVTELAAYDWVKIGERAKRLNQRDRAGTVIPDGYASRTLNTDIPASDPEALTPTERAADHRAFGKLERDPVHEANVHALSALSQAALAAGSLINHLRRGEELGVWQRPQGHTSTPCKVGPCDGEATKRGFCDTDNRADLRWQEKHNEPMPIALMEAAVIERQAKKRRKVA